MKNKILLVTEYFYPYIFGGGELSAYSLAKKLADEKLSVTVLTSKHDESSENEKRDGFNILRLLKTADNPYTLLNNFKRKKIFPISEKKLLAKIGNEFDIIHCLNNTSIVGYNLSTPASFATINSYSAFCPKGNLLYEDKKICDGQCHPLKFIKCLLNSGYMGKMKLKPYLKYNPLFWLITYADYLNRNKALNNIQKFIILNNLTKNLLLHRGIKEENIKIIPNLIHIPQNKHKVTPNNIINITYIGSLEKIKGVDLLIKAYHELKTKEAIKLNIVGEGNELKNLKGFGTEGIFYAGKVDNKYIDKIYTASDIIVIPSIWPEPLSRVMIEALSYGKPIIATDVGGNSEGVITHKNGFLTAPTVEGLRHALQYLISHPKERESMGRMSRKLFNERFGEDRVIEKLIEFYDLNDKEGI